MHDLGIEEFTTEEKEVVQLHIDNNKEIDWDQIVAAERDKDGNLYIAYECGTWYHYNAKKKEWW